MEIVYLALLVSFLALGALLVQFIVQALKPKKRLIQIGVDTWVMPSQVICIKPGIPNRYVVYVSYSNGELISFSLSEEEYTKLKGYL